MINVCPKCSAVTYDDDGWQYANKYNSTRFCLCCGTAMDSYKDGWLSDWWIDKEIEKHKEYLETHNLYAFD